MGGREKKTGEELETDREMKRGLERETQGERRSGRERKIWRERERETRMHGERGAQTKRQSLHTKSDFFSIHMKSRRSLNVFLVFTHQERNLVR